MYATEPSVPMAVFHLRATLCGTQCQGECCYEAVPCARNSSEFSSVRDTAASLSQALVITSPVAMESGALHQIKTSFLPALTMEGKVLQCGVST